jgi:SpoVK/Ycf46/Vps4 family AAA+-type ATPase
MVGSPSIYLVNTHKRPDLHPDLLDISSLVEVNIVENAIDRLVMRPETNKDTIKAIVKTYADSSQVEHFNADFIQGKGEGQIFLLHGPPGTGKTLTAGMDNGESSGGHTDIAPESVAEYTRRPLLSITAADLGHEPAELERNLLRFFNDARDWDAIVLLDEADVYLERRSAHDLRRNSIVSSKVTY